MQNRLRGLSRITNFLSRHRKRSSFVIATLAIFGVVAGYAFAADNSFDETLYTNFISVLTYAVQAIVWMLGQLFTYVISWLISAVQFNGFDNNAMIDIGWPIIRDVLNMFVVIVMVVIAIVNLVSGGNAASMQRQILMLFGGVVLMNFSQLISLLLIDGSQVVTLTFANAIKDIAAGNFVELFNAQNLIIARPADGPGGLEVFQMLGTGIMTALMLMAMIIATGAMLAAFVVRIILLWFLVTISPAAFFAWGVRGSIRPIGQIFDAWWGQFLGLLLFGPVLTFFLWLSLAIASGGNLAQSSGFDIPDVDAGFITVALSSQSMMSTILATAMLFIGLAAAVQVSSKVAIVGDIIKKGAEGGARGLYTGQTYKNAWSGAKYAGSKAVAVGAGTVTAGKYAAGAAAAGVGLAAAPAYWAADKTNQYAGGKPFEKSYSEQVRSVQQGAANILQGTRFTAGLGNKLEKSIKGSSAEQAKNADERVENMGKRSKLREVQRAVQELEQPARLTSTELANNRAVLRNVLGDKDLQKEILASMGADGERIMQQAMTASDADGFYDHIDDEKKKKELKKKALETKARNLHLLDSKEREKVIGDAVFKASMLSEEALESTEVRDQLAAAVHTRRPKRDKQGNIIEGEFDEISYLNDVERGQAGQDLRKFADNGYRKVGTISRAIQGGRFNPEMINSSEDLQEALDKGALNAQNLSNDILNQYQQEVVDHFVNQSLTSDLGKMNADVAANFAAAAKQSAAQSSDKFYKNRARGAIMATTGSLSESFGIQNDGKVPEDMQPSLEVTLTNQPQSIAKVDAKVFDQKTEFTRTVADSVLAAPRSISSQFQQVSKTGTPEEKKRWRDEIVTRVEGALATQFDSLTESQQKQARSELRKLRHIANTMKIEEDAVEDSGPTTA